MPEAERMKPASGCLLLPPESWVLDLVSQDNRQAGKRANGSMSDMVAFHKIVARFYLHLLNQRACDMEIFPLLSKCCIITEWIFGGQAKWEGDPDNLNVEEEWTDGL